MKLTNTLAAALLAALAVTAPAADLRVQVQEITYAIKENGQAQPIDHKIHAMYDVTFEEQYGSIEGESDNLSFGTVYFEVPPEQGETPNYNVYLFLRDETHEIVADGYLNNDVPGALFKLTTMLLERDGDRAYARLTHCYVPSEETEQEGQQLEAWKNNRLLQAKVQAMLARR